MVNAEKIQKVLDKVNIKIYESQGSSRTFLKVMEDISKVWDCLKDEYKLEILEALELRIESRKTSIELSFPPKDFTKINDTGIDYYRNKPTCVNDNELNKYTTDL